MSDIQCSKNQRWQNYHATREFTVADSYRFERGAAPPPDGPTRFAATARILRDHLGSLKGDTSVGIIGSAWSLSELIGRPERQLDTAELDGVSWVEPPHLHHQSRIRAHDAVFVGGGATWERVVEFIEGDHHTPRSIRTCGSYLQQSVAGSVATSTGGSRLGYGGVQNQVLGMHLVVAPDRSVWVERRSDPVLGHVAADFADEIIRDDRVFADCLVHLGGMGIVNGLVIETVPKDRFKILKARKPVDERWLERVRDGRFAEIAGSLGMPQMPAYYEVQIDPFGLFSSDAIHSMYFETDDDTAPLMPSPAIPVSGVLGELGQAIQQQVPLASVEALAGLSSPPPPVDCNDVTQALIDLFRFYSTCKVKDVSPHEPGSWSWGKIHAAKPAKDQQAIVYSAAFAVPRESIKRSLPAICDAVAGRPRQFLYTLRFVTRSAGTLAFARFPRSVVIDFEGLKPFPQVGVDAGISLERAHAALRTAGIPFVPHWGKLGEIDAGEVASTFGRPHDRRTPLGQWRATRFRILSSRADAVMWNDALRKWGVV